MKGHIIVMAHSEQLETAKRHMDFWMLHKWPITVCSPHDMPIKFLDGADHLLVTGQSGKFGKHMVERWLSVLKHVKINYDPDVVLCLEFDALVLEKISDWIVFEGIRANSFNDNDYLHFPWLIDKNSISKIVSQPIDSREGDGFMDKWLSKLCRLRGIQMSGFNGFGYTMNTIEKEHLYDAIDAVRSGAIFIHGIKDEPTLKVLIKAYDNPYT